MEKSFSFRQRVLYERKRRGWSQEEMAEKLGVNFRTVSRWERGKSFPRPQTMKKLSKLLNIATEEIERFEAEAISSGILMLDVMQSSHEVAGNLAEAVIPIPSPLTNGMDENHESVLQDKSEQHSSPSLLEDWGDAPRFVPFYGREQEDDELRRWINDEACRVVAILGMGGVGKTVLVANLSEKIKHSFRYIFWRSLHNAPPLKYTLTQCLLFLTDQEHLSIPEYVDDQISLLIECLQKQRCLLIFDNAESLLRAGTDAGHYREGYEDYGQLIQRLGGVLHQSCLLLTSREKPEEVAHLEGSNAPVRSLSLQGIGLSEGQQLLKGKGLSGTPDDWNALIQLYAGNPLALQLISEPVQEIFGGNIASFLQQGATVFGNINKVLEQQFLRLSPHEQEVLYWLAIEREVSSLEQIHEDLVSPIPRATLVTTLNSLRRRSMIEIRAPGLFALQPAIMEYVTTALVELFVHTFSAKTLPTWSHYCLLKAEIKEYLRENQRQLILIPVAQNLLEIYRKVDIEQNIHKLLERQREEQRHHYGYLAANALSLLQALQCNIRGANFSHLVVLQADLQHIALPEVNFAHAWFVKSVFTTTSGNVLSLAFSPRGDLLATGTADGNIWIYSATAGVSMLVCQGHTDAVWSVSFSPDCKLLASCSDDRTIRLWDTSTGQCLAVLEGHKDRVKAVVFHPDGTMLASGSQDQMARLWDVKDATCLKILSGHNDRIWSVAFSPDGRTLASCSADQCIRLWDVQSGQCIRILQEHTGWVLSVAFNPSGTLLASGGDDQSVRLWNVADGTSHKVLYGHTNRVRAVAFSVDGSLLASGSEDHDVRLWEVESGQCLKILSGHKRGVRSIAFNTDSKLLASGGDDQATLLWDVRTGQHLKTFQGHTDRPWSVAFNPNGRRLVSCNEDQSIYVWDIDSRRRVVRMLDYTHSPRAIACSPTSALMVSGGEDRTVRVWDTNTGQCRKILRGHTNWVRCIAFGPDGNSAASGSEDLTIRIWDVNTGLCLKVLHGHTNWLRAVTFSPDNMLLASGGDDQSIRIWERSSGTCLFMLQGHSSAVRALSFSSDGQLLASGGEDQMIFLWEYATGERVRALRGHEGWIRHVAFSPDGKVLVSGSDDYTLRLWDVEHGHCLRIFQGHSQRVREVAFSSDGETIASCSDDGTIKLWQTHNGMCISTLKSERPYEGMDITNAVGLSAIQRSMLRALGAIENL